jgi:hypothetical protein
MSPCPSFVLYYYYCLLAEPRRTMPFFSFFSSSFSPHHTLHSNSRAELPGAKSCGMKIPVPLHPGFSSFGRRVRALFCVSFTFLCNPLKPYNLAKHIDGIVRVIDRLSSAVTTHHPFDCVLVVCVFEQLLLFYSTTVYWGRSLLCPASDDPIFESYCRSCTSSHHHQSGIYCHDEY